MLTRIISSLETTFTRVNNFTRSEQVPEKSPQQVPISREHRQCEQRTSVRVLDSGFTKCVFLWINLIQNIDLYAVKYP